MFSFVTLPSASDFITGFSAWSSPIFTDLLPFVYVAIGVTLAFFIVKFLIGVFRSLMS